MRTKQARTESKLVWSGRVDGRGLPAATYQLAIAARDPAAARYHATEHILRGEQRLVDGGVISGRRRKAAARAAGPSAFHGKTSKGNSS